MFCILFECKCMACMSLIDQDICHLVAMNPFGGSAMKRAHGLAPKPVIVFSAAEMIHLHSRFLQSAISYYHRLPNYRTVVLTFKMVLKRTFIWNATTFMHSSKILSFAAIMMPVIRSLNLDLEARSISRERGKSKTHAWQHSPRPWDLRVSLRR